MSSCGSAVFKKDVMKKDDKQPDKPKRKLPKRAVDKSSAKKKPAKKQPAKPIKQDNKPIEATIVTRKYDLDLDAKKYKNSLTLGQWQELAKKNPDLLTPTQARQLAEANRQAAELAKRLAASYDFSGIAAMLRTIDTMPFARMAEQAQQSALAISKIQTSLIIPTQQLVSFQQNLMLTTGIMNQSFIAAINAANISRSFFADFKVIHDRLIKALSIDLGSLASSLSHITPTEFIDVDVIDVIDRDGNVAIISDTNQTKRIDDDYIYVSSAKLDLLLTETIANRNEIAELKQLVMGQLPSGIVRVAYADAKFIFESSKMILKGFEIPVQRTSGQAKFCDFFFSSKDNFTKKWDVVEFMAKVFNEHSGIDGNEDSFFGRIKGFAKALSDKIAIASKGQITDFFIAVNYQVYINPKYISNL